MMKTWLLLLVICKMYGWRSSLVLLTWHLSSAGAMKILHQVNFVLSLNVLETFHAPIEKENLSATFVIGRHTHTQLGEMHSCCSCLKFVCIWRKHFLKSYLLFKEKRLRKTEWHGHISHILKSWIIKLLTLTMEKHHFKRFALFCFSKILILNSKKLVRKIFLQILCLYQVFKKKTFN